ncbi:MAG: DUF1232 domain-containing protein [Alphaproteobacteria bacterium]|nr:DUF1232 domain-containing protein [Alphaproteobacteria bacterium]
MIRTAHDFAARIAADEAGVGARFFAKLRRVPGVVPFAGEALAAFYCATDRATPAWVKATLLGALAYFIAPADSIPDFIAALGYTDDAAVLLGAVKAVSSHIRPEHRARAEAFLADAG